MFTHPQFDPIAFEISIRWYGLMYLAGFALMLMLGRLHIRRAGAKGIPSTLPDDLLLYGVFGVVIGGRLGYAIFYEPMQFIGDPLAIIRVWEGGMSFHGGLVGAILAAWWVARGYRIPFLRVLDFLAPLAPPGLGLGRLGNFINAELWGRPTDVKWGVVFPNVDSLPRHPSQLYEFALEGVLLFAILWWLSSKLRPAGFVGGMFVFGYGIIRFIIEFFREPDAQLGILWLGFSMGQWLSLPMILAGLFLIFRQKIQVPVNATPPPPPPPPPPSRESDAPNQIRNAPPSPPKQKKKKHRR